jgi:RHS repeat-associated protein
MKRSSRVRRWFGLNHFWDSLFCFWEDAAKHARRRIERFLLAADQRIPRCLARPRAHLAVEGLENRFMMTTVQFSAATFSTLQNSGTMTVTVTLDALPSSNVTVNYGTSDNTAFASRDYTTTSGTLTFTPSDLNKTFTVPILNDGMTQPDDSFNVTLSSPTNATLGTPSTAAVNITNEHWPVPTASSTPQSITVGPDGNLWFVESTANKIAKMTTSGTITEYSIPTSNSAPYAIVTGSDGNLWFTENGAAQIGKITTSGSITEYSIPDAGPTVIALGPDGNIWYTAQPLTSDIGYITPAGSVTQYSTGLAYPILGITAGPDGNIWFTSRTHVYSMTTSGTITSTYFSHFTGPITLGPDGNLWYADNSSEIATITPLGTITYYTGLTDPATDITAGSNGTLWFTESSGNLLGRITTSGAFTEYIGISQTGPTSIVLGPDNGVWFTDPTPNRIGRFSGVVAGVPRSNDPGQAATVAVGGGTPFGNVGLYPQTGSFAVDAPFNLTATATASGCGCGASDPINVGAQTGLHYVSSAVVDQPIIETTYQSDPGAAVPTSLQARLTWNGGTPGSWVSFSTSGHSSGDLYDMALQVASAVTSVGYYPYTVDVQATVYGQTVTRSTSGYLAVVPLDISTNPFGNGWTLAGIDTIQSVTGGVLWIDGATAGARFFTSLGSGAFQSPPNDLGTLTENTGTGTFSYTAHDQSVYSFNSSGELTGIVNSAGVAVTYLWSSGLLTEILNPDSSITTLSYSGSNKLQSIQGPGSRSVGVTINGSGDLTGLQNPDSGLLTFTYDGSNRATNEKTGAVSTTFAYSPTNGTLTTVSLDGSTNLKLTGANTQGLSATAINYSQAVGVVKDPLSNATSYTFNPSGEKLKQVNADGSSQAWTYDFAGQPLTATDGLGKTTSYNYLYGSGNGNLAQVTNPDGTTEKFSYDSSNNLLTVTDPRGNITTNSYNGSNEVLTTTNPLGGVTTNTWASGLLQTTTDPLAHTTSYGYTTARQLKTVTDPLNEVTTYAYDSAGNQITVTDPLGRTTTTAYDAMGRATSVTQPGGQIAYTYYNVQGMVTETIDQASSATTFAYDVQNRLTSTTTAAGTALAQTNFNYYDAAGNLTGTKDANNNLTQNYYDSLNRLTGTRDALNNLTQMLYNANSQVTETIDALNHTTQFLYDSLGRQTVTIDGLGNRTTQVLDNNGNLSVAIDADGHRTSFAYNAANQVASITNPGGFITTNLYNVAGELSETFDGNNHSTTFAYDSVGRQVSVTNASHNTVTTLYDKASEVTGTTDANGNTAQFLFNSNGQITETIDAAGRATSQVYDADGRVTGSYDALGNLSKTYYNALGQVTQTTDALNNNTKSYYDAQGNLTETLDALNNATTFSYDADNRQAVVYGPLGDRTTTLYDAVGNVTQVTDAKAHSTQYVFDAAGRQSVVVDALIGRVTTLFDATGQVTGMQDQLGRTTTILLDANGQTTSTIDPSGGQTYSFYDGAGNVTETKDANNNVTTFAYDAVNRLTSTRDAGTNFTQYFNDANGNLTEIIDAKGYASYSQYNADNQVTVTIDGATNRTTQLYNARGDLTETIDGSGNTTQYGYDAADRQITVTDGASQASTTLYNAVGQVTQVIDPLGHTTQYLVDAEGRQTVLIDGVSNRTTQLFDAVGNMTSLKDASANTTTFAYDALNRKTGQTDQLGHLSTILYDAANQMTSTTDALGRQVTFSYDGAGRQTGQTWHNADGSVQQVLTFTFDAAGNNLTAANAQGTYTMTYNALNQVTLVKEMFGQTLTFTYDAVGHRTQVQDNFGTETSTYNTANQLQSRVFAGIGTTAVRIDETYRGNSQLSTLTRSSNTVGTTVVGSTTYLYDAANRVTAINHYNGSGTALATYAYSYDHAGRLTSEVDSGTRTLTYTYDNANQLTADSLHTYTYDGTGNRNNTGWSTPTGNENELQSATLVSGTWSYTYDADGNMTKKSLGASAETWTYTYDDRNEMTEAKQYTKDPGNGGVLEQDDVYKYDAFGNRVEKDVTASGVTTTQRYAYDGWNPDTPAGIGNVKWEVFADLDGTNALQTRYLRGDQVDQLFARIASDGTAAWLLTDHLGSVVNVTDNSGVLKDTIQYDGYGNITSESASSWGGRYKWTGREQDTETGLQYNRARYYDASTGRWTSQDPMGFSAGDSNLYRYVNNRSMNATDPSGKYEFDDTQDQVADRKKRAEEYKCEFSKATTDQEKIDLGLKYMQNLPGGKELYDDVMKQLDGKLNIVATDRVKSAAYSMKNSIIGINLKSDDNGDIEGIARSILFETLNAKSTPRFKEVIADADAGNVNRADFIVRIERLEYDTAVSYDAIISPAAKEGLMPEDLLYKWRDFDHAFQTQLKSGHSALYAQQWSIRFAEKWRNVNPMGREDMPTMAVSAELSRESKLELFRMLAQMSIGKMLIEGQKEIERIKAEFGNRPPDRSREKRPNKAGG